MGDLLEDIKNDDSDFLAKSSKKGSSGRKKSDLGMGPFRDLQASGQKRAAGPETGSETIPVEFRSVDKKQAEVPVSFRSSSGLDNLPLGSSPEQTGLETGLPDALPASNVSESSIVSPRLLRRNPKMVLRYLFEMASKSGERTTQKINIVEASEYLEIRYESFRTAIKVLRNYNIVERASYRSGPNGWCQFRFQKDTFKDLYDFYNGQLSKGEKLQNSGLNSGLSDDSSSSGIKNTTTTATDESALDTLTCLDLSQWNISKRSLVNHVGPGKTCETVEEMQEFLHRVAAAVDEMRKRGEKVRSPAGFLMHCLREGYVGVPEGYVSLKERRERERAEQARRELEKIQAAKKERYESEYALFRESVDQGVKARLVEEIRSKSKTKVEVVGKATFDKAIKAEIENGLRRNFCAQYRPEELRGEAEQYLLGDVAW